jgi:hypothetical protein
MTEDLIDAGYRQKVHNGLLELYELAPCHPREWDDADVEHLKEHETLMEMHHDATGERSRRTVRSKVLNKRGKNT